MRYNEYFGRVLGEEVVYRICKECGEVITENSLKIAFLKEIGINLEKEFMKKRNSKIY